MENNDSKLEDQRSLHSNGSRSMGRVLTSRERHGGGVEHLKGGNSKNKGKELRKRQLVSFILSTNTDGMPRVREQDRHGPILMELPVWRGRQDMS